jgi:hypothetical protein
MAGANRHDVAKLDDVLSAFKSIVLIRLNDGTSTYVPMWAMSAPLNGKPVQAHG